MSRSLSVAFVLPYGEPDPGFFPDTLIELCCSAALAAGHRARIVRVYYDGRDARRDAEVRARLQAWLGEQQADVVVVERLFDPEPVRAHVRGSAGRTGVALCWGSWEHAPGIDWVLGLATASSALGTRRSPAAGDLVRAFAELLGALALGHDPLDVPGVARTGPGRLEPRRPLLPAALPSPFAPTLEHDTICLGAPPSRARRHLFGNAGCPYAADPAQDPHYAGIDLPRDGSLAVLGCSFCQAGGDYQKRPDQEVIESLIEQARYYQSREPHLEELVIVDQHPVRYLEALLVRASQVGLRPSRWLFQTRADTFVRERERVREALSSAPDGHRLEAYLIGFESFSDRELGRYNKGVTAAELLAAVHELRELREEFPDRFEFARARGHSLILFGPWTTPEDLAESVAVIRRHDLGELFSELGRNRLRLYRDLPIYRLAERDGALSETWDVEGAGRRKGYSLERPWRFLDPRTRDAYALSVALRDRLGTETELDQLGAIVEVALRGEIDVERTVQEVDDLAQALDRTASAPGRKPTERGVPIFVDRLGDPRFDGAGPFVLAGGEPLERKDILDLVARAAAGGRKVSVVSSARRCADLAFTARLVQSGLSSASVRLGGDDVEQRAGVRALVDAGVCVELRACLARADLANVERLPAIAQEIGVLRLRVETSLDLLGLDRIGSARAALERLSASCRQAGMSLDACPLSAGMGWLDRVPVSV